MDKHSFEHLESIYRNYDIRGLYPNEITEDEVEKIGYAIVKRFNTKKVAVGYDIRPSSIPLKKALVKGLTEAGCNVVDLGLVTTPMTYYVCGSTDVDATVMVTASHMPSEYNGLKISIEDSKPVTKDVLQELKKIVGEHTYSSSEIIGVVEVDSPLTKWQSKFKTAHAFGGRPLRIVIDPANMIGSLEIETFRAFEPDLEVFVIYDEFDHTTPNHEANPIKPETLKDLGSAVLSNQADIGIAFDGDADRVGFVDEKGTFVPADIIGALIASVLLKKQPNSTIVYDLRSSKAVGEEILRHGGIPLEWKVGHTNIRTKMRDVDAIFGIELAGHYFFKETYFSEGGPLPAFLILELLHQTGKSLSTLVKEVQKYFHSTEINSEISKTPDEIYAELLAKFPGGEVVRMDGLKVIFPDWWFNVRPSANDPVLRLNLEAKTKEIMEEKLTQVLNIIQN
jgi:phosphomannomutase